IQLRRLYMVSLVTGPHDLAAQARQRFAQNAAAAADVEHAQAAQGVELLVVAAEVPARSLLDEAEPHRVEPVQHGHLAARIPPFGSERRKTRDLGRVDGRVASGFRPARHRPLQTAVAAMRPRRYVYAPFRAGACRKAHRAPQIMPEKPASPPWPAW